MTQKPFSKAYQELFGLRPITEAQKRRNANWYSKQYAERRRLIEEHDPFSNTMPLDRLEEL